MTLLLPGQPPPRPSRLSRGVLADPAGPDLPRFAAPARRVRHDVRDGVVVAVFSAGASTGLALVLLLLVRLAG